MVHPDTNLMQLDSLKNLVRNIEQGNCILHTFNLNIVNHFDVVVRLEISGVPERGLLQPNGTITTKFRKK